MDLKISNDHSKIKQKYDSICVSYIRLGKNLKDALEGFLKDEEIKFLDVIPRVKSLESFIGKIERKGYKDPFNDIEDICGLRIICPYPSDLEKITDIIKREFNVLESIDKTDLLDADRFGYRSLHFIVTIKKAWLNAPNYRGLGDLKVEIQVRTILMHAWADIEHELAYKKEEHAPYQLQRKLSQLAALMEISDLHLDSLQKEKENYREKVSEEAEKSGRFDITQPLNKDTLQAFLDFYFPDRKKGDSDLIDELLKNKVSMKDLVEGYEKTKEILPQIEKENFKGKTPGKKWTQAGIVRSFLDLTNEPYWQYRKTVFPDKWVKLKEKWRTKLSKEKM